MDIIVGALANMLEAVLNSQLFYLVTGALLTLFITNKSNKKKVLAERQLEAIVEIYKSLDKCLRYMEAVTCPAQRVSGDEYEKRVEDAHGYGKEFQDTYSACKILLPLDLANELDDLDSDIATNWGRFQRGYRDRSSEWDESYSTLKNDISVTKKKLENKFRELLR